jgi:N-acylglucosamine 2-epimerase
MNQKKIVDYRDQYKNALLGDVIPFWCNHSVDWEYGGYLTNLDRTGNVFDTDKFSWLQGRQIWFFSMIFQELERRETWLKIAGNGIHFLKKYGRDKNTGSFYFSWDRMGIPLVQPYNIFSDCFAALGFYGYAQATGDEESLQISLQTYRRFIDRAENPKGIYDKSTGNRPLSGFGIPMMTAWLTAQLHEHLPVEEAQRLFEHCIDLILRKHRNPETGIIHEFVSADHSFIDTYEGRLLNPGHVLEAMWFLIDIADHQEQPIIVEEAVETTLQMLEYAWDQEYGGIFYFMDARQSPPLHLEWDQKLWWVHLEALIALAKAYRLTGRKDVLAWFDKVHAYTWSHFPDPEFGEWFGYLNRHGKPHILLKGGKWKGCFHVPRGLYICWQELEKVLLNC